MEYVKGGSLKGRTLEGKQREHVNSGRESLKANTEPGTSPKKNSEGKKKGRQKGKVGGGVAKIGSVLGGIARNARG